MSDLTKQQLEYDVAFLLERAGHAGCCSFVNERCTGISSNALVHFAYSGQMPGSDQYPSDVSDLNACERTYRMLPAHRKTEKAMYLLEKYRESVLNKYPIYEQGPDGIWWRNG